MTDDQPRRGRQASDRPKPRAKSKPKPKADDRPAVVRDQDAEAQLERAGELVAAEHSRLAARVRTHVAKAKQIKGRKNKLPEHAAEHLAAAIPEAAERFYTVARDSGYLSALVKGLDPTNDAIPDATLVGLHVLASSADSLTFQERVLKAIDRGAEEARAAGKRGESLPLAGVSADDLDTEAERFDIAAEEARTELTELEPRRRAIAQAQRAANRGADRAQLLSDLDSKGYLR